jgi:hypothetical protein
MRFQLPLRWIFCLAWLCMPGLAAAAPPHRDWPAIPSPSDARTYWIAEYMEHNTIPMQIRGFESGESMQEISRYYEKWFAGKTSYGVSNVGESRVLGARLGVYQVTVQLRAVSSGTIGRLVAAVIYEEGGSAQERAERIGKGFPRPPGSQFISDTVSYDEGQRNRTIMLINGMSVEANGLYLREQMIRLGWALLQDRTVDGGERSALVFRRGREEMVVTIARRDDTYLVVASQTTPD